MAKIKVISRPEESYKLSFILHNDHSSEIWKHLVTDLDNINLSPECK